MRQKLMLLSAAATLLAFVVVGMGAYTRLVDAGLGCPDWPGCYGFLSVPQSEAHIELAEMRFPDAPVDVEKGWPEMIHRYIAGTLGLVILTIFIGSLYWRCNAVSCADERKQVPWGHSLILLLLVIAQALFGMWTVTLKLWPQVVSTHLLGGFTTLSLLYLLYLRLKLGRTVEAGHVQSSPSHPVLWSVLIGVVFTIVQIFLGAWLAANYAAVACPDFPTCQGQWLPDANWRAGFDFTQQVGPNYLGGILTNEARVAIHWTHRLGAVLLVVYWFILAMRYGAFMLPAQRRALVAVLIVLIVQIVLGIANVLLSLPISVALLHNLCGALLLLSVVRLGFRVWSPRVVPAGKTIEPDGIRVGVSV